MRPRGQQAVGPESPREADCLCVYMCVYTRVCVHVYRQPASPNPRKGCLNARDAGNCCVVLAGREEESGKAGREPLGHAA
mmetsp:Transcript_13502/g.36553  ORF Transcript_13502/g.36553 Transcript_13502/m.36553 type:complete len:80 (+) Transcript_13502:1472-1711(+)|eukprot:800372-Pelagomonas_calceolata.AAC.1